jgi:hypothetical protein
MNSPLLSINAFDDPILDGRTIPISSFTSSTHVYAAITGSGGHLGWFDGVGKKSRWVLKPVREFLSAAKRELGMQGNPVEVVRGNENGPEDDEKEERDGGWEWVKEAAHEMVVPVGWRVLKEGEIVEGQEGTGVLQGL